MGQKLAGTKTRTAAGSAGDITIVERIEFDRPGGITQQGADRASHIGLALLIALNVIDIVLTRRFLALGLEEGNPLMAVAVRSWTARRLQGGHPRRPGLVLRQAPRHRHPPGPGLDRRRPLPPGRLRQPQRHPSRRGGAALTAASRSPAG